ncbi:MAG: porin [Steroidobacteraceae bacterium]
MSYRPLLAAEVTPSTAELYQIIKDMRAELDAVKKVLAEERAQRTGTASVEQQLKAQQEQIDAMANATASDTSSALHLGGYGELHYNNLSAKDSANDLKEIDFHRFVLYAGYDFTDRLRLHSELELEHAIASAEDAGEIELEQAFIEYDVGKNWTTRAGLMLIPMGILNETHEPTTFYGVERNDVESIIIPGTWRGAGIGSTLRWDNGLSWDVMLHEGLAIETSGSDAYRVRSGQQEASEALAADLAVTTRLRYTGIPGLELGVAVQYQNDASQIHGDGIDSGLLYEAHAIYNHGPLGIRALYSAWDFAGAGIAAANSDSQTGWYLEPSWRVSEPLGFYARYEDVQAARGQDRFTQWEGGMNYWPHPQVVAKLDYRKREHDRVADSGLDFKGFDLGLGYRF